MAELFAIGDLGDTTDDLLSYAGDAGATILDAFDPFSSVTEGVQTADALTNGGGSADDGSGSSSVPLGEGGPDPSGGGFSFASGGVPGASAAVAYDQGAGAAAGTGAGGAGGTSPGVVSGGGGMVVAPSAPIGPGTTTPTGTPWVKYGIGALVVGGLAYAAWRWMNRRPKRQNPRKRRRKGRR